MIALLLPNIPAAPSYSVWGDFSEIEFMHTSIHNTAPALGSFLQVLGSPAAEIMLQNSRISPVPFAIKALPNGAIKWATNRS